MSRIDDAFTKHGCAGSARDAYLRPMVEAFEKSGAADSNYLDALNSDDEGQFWSRVWEAMLHSRFEKLGWTVSGGGAGPDFKVQTKAGPVLVEATAPAPDGIPADWLEPKPGTVQNFPHKEILLRWTSKLKDKRDKHVADIAKGIVSAETPFVIAINSRRLGYAPDENGISGWPFAVEATFPIGPMAVKVDPETSELGEAFQSLRFSVEKKPGVEVPTGNFLDPDYKCVSGLIGCPAWHSDAGTLKKFAAQPPYFVVHNPLATNPLPKNWLPDAIEYAATKTADDEYTLTRPKRP